MLSGQEYDLTKHELILLDLLHDMYVKIEHLYCDDKNEAFGIDFYGMTDKDVASALHKLSSFGYLSTHQGYVGLTHMGGQVWSETFCVDWSKYFFVETQFVNPHQERIKLYANDVDVLKLAINYSGGMFDISQIQKITWQPIYWHDKFDGFCVETMANSEHLPPYCDIMPRYKQFSL